MLDSLSCRQSQTRQSLTQKQLLECKEEMSRVIAFARKTFCVFVCTKLVEKIVQSSRLMFSNRRVERKRAKTNSALLSLFSNYRLSCFPFHPRTHFCPLARFLMNINVSQSRGKAFSSFAFFPLAAKAHMFISRRKEHEHDCLARERKRDSNTSNLN